MEILRPFFELPAWQFGFMLSLFLTVFCVAVWLVGGLIRLMKNIFWPDYSQVGIRYYVEPKKELRPTAPEDERADVYFCPQCYLITHEPGICGNDEHVTEVRLCPGSTEQLGYYKEMQELINPESTSDDQF